MPRHPIGGRTPARTVPAYDELLWPTLVALKAMGGSASNDELLGKLIELEHISEDVASFIHTDNRQTKLAYNLAWAKTYLKRVGAVESGGRGVWAITKAGETMTQADAAAVPAQVRRQDYELSVHQTKTIDPTADEALSPIEPPVAETWKNRDLSNG